MMKRANYLLEKIVDPDNLRLAFWKAGKGKRYAKSVSAYARHLDNNLIRLRAEIGSGEISVGQYRYFKVFDPKERQICASAFSEQVLHHALMNICHPYFERAQVFDSYASRPGKGFHAAVKRAAFFHRMNNWYLKLDVRQFFASINHEVLLDQLEKLFKEKSLIHIFNQIIASFESKPGYGLPIGNLSSQYFANHYLTGLDHYIKEKLHIKAYVRYMDDFVLWHQDKQCLKYAYQNILRIVESELKVSLKPLVLQKVERGLPFCGYLIYPYYIRLSQRSKKRYGRKMDILQEQYQVVAWSESECQRRAQSLISFTQLADAKVFRQMNLQRFESKNP